MLAETPALRCAHGLGEIGTKPARLGDSHGTETWVRWQRAAGGTLTPHPGGDARA